MSRTERAHDSRNAALTALVALALLLVWLPLTVRCNYGGNWSALFCSGAKLKAPPELEAGTYTFANSYGYDGQYYRYIAHDPFFRKGYARYIDSPHFRYRRGLVPLLAWTLALGRPGWIDRTLIAVVLASIAAGVYWSARYAAWRGAHAAWGLLFLPLPAAVASADRILTDGTLAALFAGFVYYAAREHWKGLYAVSALAVLTRETGLLLVAGMVVFQVWKRCPKRALFSATAVLPAVLWYGFVTLHAAIAPTPGNITLPFAGWIAGIGDAPADPTPWVDAVLRASRLIGLAGAAGSVTLAVRWAWKGKAGPAEVVVLSFAAMTLVLGAAVACDPYAYGRAISPLLLWVMLEAAAGGAYAALLAPLGVCAAAGVTMGTQVVGVVRGVLSL